MQGYDLRILTATDNQASTPIVLAADARREHAFCLSVRLDLHHVEAPEALDSVLVPEAQEQNHRRKKEGCE
jgi:hypothetical protein